MKNLIIVTNTHLLLNVCFHSLFLSKSTSLYEAKERILNRLSNMSSLSLSLSLLLPPFFLFLSLFLFPSSLFILSLLSLFLFSFSLPPKHPSWKNTLPLFLSFLRTNPDFYVCFVCEFRQGVLNILSQILVFVWLPSSFRRRWFDEYAYLGHFGKERGEREEKTKSQKNVFCCIFGTAF